MTRQIPLKPIWIFLCCCLALWLGTFRPQESPVVLGGMLFLVAAGVALTPAPLLRRGIWLVGGLVLLGVVLFQVPPIRDGVSFPLLTRLFPQTNIFSPFGLSDSDYAIYQTIRGQEVHILDARLNAVQPLRLVAKVTVQNHNETYFRGEPLNRWRETKDPADLIAGGITHLYVDAQWLGYLSEAEYQRVTNPAEYQPIWVDAATGVYFYRVLAP